MIHFHTLTPKQVAALIATKKNIVLCVKQTISETDNQPKNETFQLGMPYMPIEVVEQILGASVLYGHEEKTRWITYTVMVNAIGGSMEYENINLVDCLVTVRFN